MAKFLIDKSTYEINLKGKFYFGPDKVLSTKETDPCYDQEWYSQGYKISNLFSESEFNLLYKGINNCICKFSKKNKFPLEKYHEYIKDDQTHMEIVKKTRDLFPEDFNFDVKKIIRKLELLMGFPLTDIDPDTNKKLHIIVRINRPFSNDYNPPHKDIYQQYDETGIIPKCINFWIPICGVTFQSMLPLAKSSHLLPENKIYRTKDGGIIEKNKYRVRSVLHWDGSNKLSRPKIKDGQVLIFSSHLIHGCAINEQKYITRVALEFRLFKGKEQ